MQHVSQNTLRRNIILDYCNKINLTYNPEMQMICKIEQAR